MALLLGLEAQPRFPREDSSSHNADMIELLLANFQVVAQAHDKSEAYISAFRLMHPAVVQATARSFKAPALHVIDHGVVSVEAMSMLVQAYPEESAVLKLNSTAIASGASENGVLNYAFDARERFQEELPRATEVIKTSSGRFFPGLTDYAILGAALACQLELDSDA